MTDITTDFIQTASDLITEFGTLVTWNTIVDSAAADPNKKWKPGASQLTPYLNVPVLFLDSNRIRLEFAMLGTGMEVPEGYMRAIIAGDVPFTPTLKDTFTVNGKTYSVEWLDPVQPQGTPIIWKMGIAAP